MGSAKQPRIEIGYLADNAELIFYVADNGIGIEPQYQDTVFELFERLNPDIKGTGLGLALARRIVELHNGRFWLESEGLGKGSTFFFTIPNPTPNELNDSPYPDRQTET
jgi:signal transduction histidine kinase